jgi:hypothetical protein
VRFETGRLKAIFGNQSGDVLSAGGDAFLVDWNPGAPADHWTFQVVDGEVTGLDWSGRPFVRRR